MRNPVTRGPFHFRVTPASANSQQVTILEAAREAEATPTVVVEPRPRTKSRHERRKDKVFNRQLERRLQKDGVPATVELLPDGGVHVTVRKPEEA